VRENHIRTALSAGYRFLDTAQSYNWGYHEHEVGSAVHNHITNTNEQDIFIQTKIHPEDLGYEATRRAVSVSLKRLGLSSIDSVLIHKPRCWEGACNKEPEGTWRDSWRALQELYEAGVIRASIGICDVDDKLLDELLTQKIRPHIIQNWMDPLNQDTHMRKRCQSAGIQYQAYSSLGTQWHHRGHKENPVLKNPILLNVANKYSVDVAQIVINWATTHGVSVLPASTNPGRQRNNLVDSFGFVLTAEDMQLIDALDGMVPRMPKTDPNEVQINFLNQADGPVETYWFSDAAGDTGEEVHVGSIEGGGALSLTTHNTHKFIFRDAASGISVGEHVVLRDDGKDQTHIVGGSGEL